MGGVRSSLPARSARILSTILFAAIAAGCSNLGVTNSDGLFMTKVSGDGQSGAVATPLPQPIIISVRNNLGEGVSTSVCFRAVGGGTLDSADASGRFCRLSDAYGMVAAVWTLRSTVGTDSVVAEVAGLHGVTFTATAW